MNIEAILKAASSWPNLKNPVDLFILVGLVLVVGVGGTWLLLGGDDESPRPIVTVTAPPDFTSSQLTTGADQQGARDIESELEKARLAMEVGQYLEPPENSALFHYFSVLQLRPDHIEANEGVDKIIQIMMDEAENAIRDGRIEDAAETVKRANEVRPGHLRIADVEQQLARQQTERVEAALALVDSGDLDRADRELAAAAEMPYADPDVLDRASQRIADARKAVAAKAAEAAKAAKSSDPPPKPEAKAAKAEVLDGVELLLANATTSLTEGRLVQPEEDNAYFYLRQAQDLDSDNPDLRESLEALSTRLIDRARAEVRAYEFDAAAGWLGYVEELGMAEQQVADVRAEVARRRVDAETNRVMPASQLEIVKYVPPEYPGLAVRRRVSGWVDVEFTVVVSGETRDIQVVGVEREGYFEESAVAAVQEWEFKPRVFEGQQIPQRVSLRMSFDYE